MIVSNNFSTVSGWMQPKTSVRSAEKTFSSEALSKVQDSDQNDPVSVYQDLCAEFPDITFRLEDKTRPDSQIGYKNSLHQVGKNFGEPGQYSISIDISVIRQMQQDPEYAENVRGKIEFVKGMYRKWAQDAAADNSPYISVTLDDEKGRLSDGITQSGFPYSTEEQLLSMRRKYTFSSKANQVFTSTQDSLLDTYMEMPNQHTMKDPEKEIHSGETNRVGSPYPSEYVEGTVCSLPGMGLSFYYDTSTGRLDCVNHQSGGSRADNTLWSRTISEEEYSKMDALFEHYQGRHTWIYKYGAAAANPDIWDGILNGTFNAEDLKNLEDQLSAGTLSDDDIKEGCTEEVKAAWKKAKEKSGNVFPKDRYGNIGYFSELYKEMLAQKLKYGNYSVLGKSKSDAIQFAKNAIGQLSETSGYNEKLQYYRENEQNLYKTFLLELGVEQ